MSQYIFILVWIAAMFFLKSVMSGGYRVENILGKKEYRVSWGFAAFAFCPVVIMATFRGDMGDSYAYKTMFRNLPNTISGLLNYIPSVTSRIWFIFACFVRRFLLIIIEFWIRKYYY